MRLLPSPPTPAHHIASLHPRLQYESDSSSATSDLSYDSDYYYPSNAPDESSVANQIASLARQKFSFRPKQRPPREYRYQRRRGPPTPRHHDTHPCPSSTTPTLSRTSVRCTFCGHKGHSKHVCCIRGTPFQPKEMQQNTNQFNVVHGKPTKSPQLRQKSHLPTSTSMPPMKFLTSPVNSSPTKMPIFTIKLAPYTAQKSTSTAAPRQMPTIPTIG